MKSLQEAAQERSDLTRLVDDLDRQITELQQRIAPLSVERAQYKDRIKALDRGMMLVKRVAAIRVALDARQITYEGDLAYMVSQSYLATLFHLVAVGSKGTGLYLGDGGEWRRGGKEYVVRLEQVQAVGGQLPPEHRVRDSHGSLIDEPRQLQRDVFVKAGLSNWTERGKGDFGWDGAIKPTPPPEGGRWQWLKINDQKEIAA